MLCVADLREEAASILAAGHALDDNALVDAVLARNEADVSTVPLGDDDSQLASIEIVAGPSSAPSVRQSTLRAGSS
jgi:hypothetical protein